MLHHSLAGTPYLRARTIHLILESRDAIGPSIRRLGNSDCIVLTFPRDALRRVSTWPELHRSGIYLLIAPQPEIVRSEYMLERPDTS
jgi:hypothetical protein